MDDGCNNCWPWKFEYFENDRAMIFKSFSILFLHKISRVSVVNWQFNLGWQKIQPVRILLPVPDVMLHTKSNPFIKSSLNVGV